jgi:threonine aldolase
LLAGDRWRQYASHANAMAQRLYERVRGIRGVRVTRPVRSNAVFATLQRAGVERLQERYYFYVFNQSLPEVRWMTHWATSEQDVDDFAACLEEAAGPG